MKITIGENKVICNTNINTILQYFLIYLLIISHGAKIYSLNEWTFTYMSLIIGAVYILMNRNKFQNKYIVHMLLIAVLMFVLVFVHSQPYFVTVAIKVIEPLILLFTAFNIDKEHFFNRVVKAILFFAVISLGFYLVQIFVASKLKQYLVQVPGWELSDFYGTLFYTYRGVYAGFRNNGIFTEPGLYQMVLNAALMIELYFPEYLEMPKKHYTISILLLIITILTTGSTTGYMSLGIIIVGFLVKRNTDILNRRARRYVIGIIVVVLIFLIINNSMRGTDSILNIFVFSKFNEMQSFENASGNARLSMMNVCGEIIKNNPLALFLGSGFTALTNAIVTSGVYATGAFIVSFAIAAGIPVAIFVYYPYILKPILKKKNIILGLVFALVWLNTSLAQSRYIYPFLILLPYLLDGANRKRNAIEVER